MPPFPQNPWKDLIYTLGNLKKSELKIILTGQVGCVGWVLLMCVGEGGGGGNPSLEFILANIFKRLGSRFGL